MSTEPLLGVWGMAFMGLYLLSLILIGVLGKMASREASLADFYLAGRGMGFFVLFLTLYATQYSGNTLIGFAGQAYREGYMVLVSVTFMMSIIAAYFIFAPRLHRMSKALGFITIGDYIHHRFASRALRMLTVAICIVALGNYILTNLKAMGFVIEFTTGGHMTAAWGIVSLSVIMVLYETLGGLRSVAWTDAIQGIILLIGILLIFSALEYQYGGLTVAAEYFTTHSPELWAPPTAEQKRQWLSMLIIVFFGISMYPHAFQRIFAAKSERTLKRSLRLMVFMPLFTTLPIVIIGVVGSAKFIGLDRAGSEQVVLYMLGDLSAHIPFMGALTVLFLTAVVAAIMSTIDSALLAISSLVTQDVYGVLKPSSSQLHLTRVGKITSWVIMGVMAYLAIVLPQTIWRLMEIKLEILCQIAPAVFLGIHVRSLGAGAVLSGMVVGTAVAVAPTLGGLVGLDLPTKPGGFHMGVIGLAMNLLTVALISLWSGKRTPARAVGEAHG